MGYPSKGILDPDIPVRIAWSANSGLHAGNIPSLKIVVEIDVVFFGIKFILGRSHKATAIVWTRKGRSVWERQNDSSSTTESSRMAPLRLNKHTIGDRLV